MTVTDVSVVGAGVSGLANAFELAERGVDVTVWERRPRAGGNVRTDREDGYVVEHGPNGFLDNVPETLDLVRRLGLEDELLVSSDAARVRFLWRRGALHRLPEKPPSFFTSPLLSRLGRARVLLEPIARGRPRSDETVWRFAARRIGPEAADVLVQAMVSGVYAGNARRLSLRSTFPKMWAMETEHGGLLRAMIARKKAGKAGGGPAGPGGTLTSFRGGMQTLVDRLVERLGDRVRLDTPVTGLSREGGRWRLEGPDTLADAVILACPAAEAAEILRGLAPRAGALLAGIPTAPIAVVATAFDESATDGPPPGFGFLVPRGEGVRMLGCLWSSSIYPGGRAPAGKVLLRSMIGGALDPGAVDLAEEELFGIVLDEVRKTMGVRGDPVRHRVFRYPRGIPQYVVGHGRRLAEVADVLRDHPGIHLAGNSYRGISVNAVIQEARGLAASL